MYSQVIVLAFSGFFHLFLHYFFQQVAIVHNAYKEVLRRAHAEWTIARAKCIVYIELLYMTPSERQNRYI